VRQRTFGQGASQYKEDVSSWPSRPLARRKPRPFFSARGSNLPPPDARRA